MNSILKHLIGLLLVIGSSPLFAQIELNNVSVGTGLWNRTYAGVDERSFLIGYEQASTYVNRSLIPFISAELNVWQGFAIDARIGYWRKVLESHGLLEGDFRIAEQLDQRIVPLYAGVVYNFPDIIPKYLKGFAGGGISRYFIDNRFSRKVEDGLGDIEAEPFRGNNYGVNGKVGIEYLFPEFVSLVFEARYHRGFYHQTTVLSGDLVSPATQRVDLAGLELGLAVRYTISY
ncbi:hypothetical protein [Lunatimonas salinarum]|uniref:hypothetical protein n=1 Tax=Lunatimonas salinarum TaxID=1774590 RepID=UPI001ADFDA16|nr:hypothetical protein [Lunatimonas salinarum]